MSVTSLFNFIDMNHTIEAEQKVQQSVANTYTGKLEKCNRKSEIDKNPKVRSQFYDKLGLTGKKIATITHLMSCF